MKKMISICLVGMFVIIGYGTVVFGEPDDSSATNRPPTAPVVIEQKSNWQKECYICTFYSIDYDGDEIYYDISWEKIDEPKIVSEAPDNPNGQWLGPFKSGAEIESIHNFYEIGNYKVTIRAKDTYGNIGHSTIIEVNHKHFKLLDLPFFSNILEKHPRLSEFLTNLF